jgi:hypothetical protein
MLSAIVRLILSASPVIIAAKRRTYLKFGISKMTVRKEPTHKESQKSK